MKTKMNMNPAARMSFAVLALVLSAAGTVKASELENKVTLDVLDQMDQNVTELIKYKAPEAVDTDAYVVSESEVYELQAAEAQLDNMNAAIEESLKYKAPEVSGDVNEYEVQIALESLDSFVASMDESIKF